MRAQPYFESQSSAGFIVGVGCPSFGGQRTDRGGSSRLLAAVVTALKPLRHAEPAGGFALNSQLEASSAKKYFVRFSAVGRVVALGQPMGEAALKGLPNLKCKKPEVSTRQRRSSVAESQSLSAVAASRCGQFLALPGWPNPSVKGTSRKRAAPYVER